MKVLVVGSGGREHALVWKIAESKKVKKIFCVPGNAGIAKLAECVDLNSEDIPALVRFAEENSIDLTVVGPETPLVKGVVDEFEKNGLKVFGPSKKAAQLEGSKVFAKEFMKRHSIPTAGFRSFQDKDSALKYIDCFKGNKLVVKADGLAAGKGVLICNNKNEARKAVEKIMIEKAFGEAGKKVVIEEFLGGEEASILAFCDGKTAKLMVSSQDHKRALDGDKGPNTGGMGAYSPAPLITAELEKKIYKEIIKPTVDGLRQERIPYKGVLYAGLMISNNKLNVLELNERFGDPETHVVLPRLKSDLIEVMLACIGERLNEMEIEWSPKATTCVVLASGGYPDSYKKGKIIYGLDKAARLKNVFVFHAGTAFNNHEIITSGGRVLGVTALGEDIKHSIDLAYKAVLLISFDKMHYRKDIGLRALNRGKGMLRQKQQLRRKLLNERNRLTKQQITGKSALIKEKLFSLKEFQQARTVCFYASFGSEVVTRGMIDDAKKLGKKILIPKTDWEKNCLGLAKFSSWDELIENSFGIPEPKKAAKVNLNKIDLVVVPGLGFDLDGNRLGFGKGFYDKFAYSLPKKIPLVALAFELQLVEKLPVNESDRKVNKIISEKRIIQA